MTKPTDYPDWCLDGVRTLALTSGHILSGWDVSEVPTHNELNAWMRSVGLWTRYIDPILDYRWSWWSPAFGSLLTHFTVAGGGAPSYVASSGSSGVDPAVCQSPLRLPVGAIVTDIGARVHAAGGLGNSITLALVKTKSGVTTPVYTHTFVPTDGVWADYPFTLTTPEAIDDSAYWVEVSDAGGNNIEIAALGARAHP